MTPSQADTVRVLSGIELPSANEAMFVRLLAESPAADLKARDAAYLERLRTTYLDDAGTLRQATPTLDDDPDLPFHPLANLFPLIEGEAFDELVTSIRENGQRETIILHEGQILDGRNRYRACRAAGRKPRTEKLPRGVDPLLFVIDHNLRRRHMTDDQRRMVAARIANLRRGEKSDGNTAIGGISRDEAATMLAVDPAGVERARAVVTKGAEELQEAVDSRKLTVRMAADLASLPVDRQREIVKAADPKVLREFVREVRAEKQAEKRARRETRETELGARQAALPEKRYGVIYADPEWRFEPWSRETGMDRAADNHYPTSVTEVIAARPVETIAARDAALFLWSTSPMQPHAQLVMAAWGFDFVSQVIWVKDRICTGFWFRNKHEVLLVGTRGNVPAPAMGAQWPSVVEAPVGEHSEKPEIFAEMIEAYFPSLPKIELNARRRRPGWDAWGLEAPGDDAATGRAD